MKSLYIWGRGAYIFSRMISPPSLLTSLKEYNRKTFFADLAAGLTVGVVALPLAMAFAIACGHECITPSVGLVTAIVAGFFISLLSGSRFQIGGPTGAFVVIIAGVVASYGFNGLVLCTLMAGFFLMVFGFCRMGALIKFIPYPVTTGFTSGIAVTILCTQVKDILGLDIPVQVPAEFIEKWECYFEYMHTISPWATGLTVFTVVAILASRKFFPKLPSMLVGMLLATAVTIIFKLPVETIGSRFGELPTSLPMPGLPEFEWNEVAGLVKPAIVIALLAAIESLLSAAVADGMTGTRHHPNTELVAQGAGNIASAFFGGLPATGAIARTATNIKAGGKTPVSGLIHAVTLLLILLVAGQYAAMVPLSALAGILVLVCYNMAEIPTFRHLLRGPKQDCAVLLITFILTVLIDLVVAVEVGVILAALLFISRMAHMSQVSVVREGLDSPAPDEDPSRSRYLRDVPTDVEIFDVQGPFFFGAVERFKDIVFGRLNLEVKYIVIRLRLVPALDASGMHALESLMDYCKKRNIHLLLCGVQAQPLRVIHKDTPFMQDLHEENICTDLDAALERVAEIRKGKETTLEG